MRILILFGAFVLLETLLIIMHKFSDKIVKLFFKLKRRGK